MSILFYYIFTLTKHKQNANHKETSVYYNIFRMGKLQEAENEKEI